MGTTLSEVRVSQGVDELEAGATLEGPAELVATGTTISEVRVSQGVDEAPALELTGLGVATAEELGEEPEPPPMTIAPLRSIPVNQPSRVRRMSTPMSMPAAPPRTAAS